MPPQRRMEGPSSARARCWARFSAIAASNGSCVWKTWNTPRQTTLHHKEIVLGDGSRYVVSVVEDWT